MFLLLLVLCFLDSGPSIAQGYGPVKYEPAGGTAGINTEVAQPLELAPAQRLGISQRRLDAAIVEDLK